MGLLAGDTKEHKHHTLFKQQFLITKNLLMGRTIHFQ